MEILKKLDLILVRVVRVVLAFVGLAVAFLLAFGIFSRAVLNAPIFGLEEVVMLGAMWFYMLGASLASRERLHLSADFISVITSSPKVWRIAKLTSGVISLFVAVMFVRWAWSLFAFGLDKGQSTPVFAIPWWVSQSSLFIAAVFFVLYLVRDLIQSFFGHDAESGDPSARVE